MFSYSRPYKRPLSPRLGMIEDKKSRQVQKTNGMIEDKKSHQVQKTKTNKINRYRALINRKNWSI